MIELEVHEGKSAQTFIEELAALRIIVFREFPYLYSGDVEYERKYLEKFVHTDQCVLVVVKDKNRVVGASSGLPVVSAEPEIQDPLRAAGHSVDEMFYFGESVLLPEYRGRGIGHAFFDRREDHAAQLGFSQVTFVSVMREADHPEKPAGYVAHDQFWNKRGFQRIPEVFCELVWAELGKADEGEIAHKMEYWRKPRL